MKKSFTYFLFIIFLSQSACKSPINGFIKRIIQTGGSDGKLNIELLIETNS